MSPDELGGFVAEKPRNAIQINFIEKRVLVNGMQVDSGLGFSHNKAMEDKRAFSERLLQVVKAWLEVLDPGLLPKSLPQEPEAALDALEPVLKFTGPQRTQALKFLRQIGAPLRAQLSEEMEQKLRNRGFLEDEAPQNHEEPALTFLILHGDEDTVEPVYWEMMYKGKQAESLNPDMFWGFRTPVTQWLVRIDRREDIRLNRILSIDNEKLSFAGHEASMLMHWLNPQTQQYENPTEAFRRKAEKTVQDLRRRFPQEVDEIQALWLQCQDQRQDWLRCLLAWLEGKGEDTDTWKLQALTELFLESQPYDLIHFASHCEASATASLSQLRLTVAGVPVSLAAGFMRSDLQRQREWKFVDPGPLVFLNACSTGKPSATPKPPVFPLAWIEAQGAKAVIATLCPIPDIFAYAFALKFYHLLFTTTPFLAEALLQTRRYFLKRFDNPLGLAYTLYAVQHARVDDDFVTM